MFNKCEELEYLDISNFDFSNVNSILCMFAHCYKLKEIKGITDIKIPQKSYRHGDNGVFGGCQELDYLILSKKIRIKYSKINVKK